MKSFKPKNSPAPELAPAGLPWLPRDLVNSLAAITFYLRGIFSSGVSRIGLYGSWQRGAASPESDVDLVVFLAHEVAWFDAENGVIDRSAALKDNQSWHRVEKRANALRLDSRDYSIAMVTPAMLEYYRSRGPIHLQNWASALVHCYPLWEACWSADS